MSEGREGFRGRTVGGRPRFAIRCSLLAARCSLFAVREQLWANSHWQRLLFFLCNPRRSPTSAYALSRCFFHHGASAAGSAWIPTSPERGPARTCRDQSVFGEPVR